MWVGERSPERSHAAVDGFIAALRRHRVALIVWTAACLGFAAVHVRLTTPQYIGSVQLVLQSGHKAQDGPEIVRFFNQLALDSQQMQTQLGLIRSDRLLRYVFDALRPGDAQDGSGGSPSVNVSTPRADAFQDFVDRVSSRRVGLSYVIEIAYRAPDPKQAARVANAIAAAYVHDRVTTAVADAQVNTPYLKSRIAAIMSEVMVAAGAVAAGVVPDQDFADADVRLLGPAIEPDMAYPKRGPIMVFALGFGLISGLVAIALRHAADRTVQSRQQVVDCFGLDCVSGDLTGSAGTRDAGLETFARRLRPPVARSGSTSGALARPLLIGVMSWAETDAARAAAAWLAVLLTKNDVSAIVVQHDDERSSQQASNGAASDLLRFASRLQEQSAAQSLIVVLPALDDGFEGQALAPLLDAALLVVQAHRTTVADVEAAIRALDAVGSSFTAVLLGDRAKPKPRPLVGRRRGPHDDAAFATLPH